MASRRLAAVLCRSSLRTSRQLATVAPGWRQALSCSPSPAATQSIPSKSSGAGSKPSNDILEDPYYRKYEDKIKLKVQSAGLKSIEEYKQLLKGQTDPQPTSHVHAQPSTTAIPSNTPQKPPISRFSPPATIKSPVKPLSEILRTDLVLNLDAEGLTQIWNDHHSQSQRDVISGVMTQDFYKKHKERARQFPTFILPLPRKEGFEFFYIQHSGSQTYLTSLLEFKTHGGFARPCLVMTYYDDLVSRFGIVLMLGEITSHNRTLNAVEARNLAYQIQLFYVNGNTEKLELVEKFHRDPKGFNYQDLIAEIGRIA
ncbi:hypothetical protein SeMB42_g06276 [Synchytrium endobioticum]|uniref:ATP synthase mitochondrial F1 complex assembly factor 1 n=1 Tax=Synchytrium endobioticum TaxID=286115 RepID=A0A507CM97_9FUNG|nr:hypothetical protein SeMB42_g06276 [Synchytrium endobioticum]TPX40275.1 hypothetical protein SeLEV6574_g06706 [Synchytrium endobioticum]